MGVYGTGKSCSRRAFLKTTSASLATLTAAGRVLGTNEQGGSLPDDALVLVGRGKVAKIVVADRPTASARLAAEELQSWIRKISRATVPIEAEGQIRRDGSGTLILVGDTAQTAALGLSSSSFAPEEIRIRTFPHALAILGNDARPDGVALFGTRYAVQTFVEQHLGIRALWPGPLGEIVPQREEIAVGAIDYRYAPVLNKRDIRRTWEIFSFHKLGTSFVGEYNHAFSGYWARFHADHPDWFALQPDGTRDNSRAEQGTRAQLCVSNPELIHQVAADCIDALRKNPTWQCAPISPNDGGQCSFCLCERCRSWDDPRGVMIDTWGGPGGQKLHHVSLTDRHVRFYSAVAEIVTRQFPDRWVGGFAYSAYCLPPVHATLHPNVLIGYVGLDYLNEAKRQEARDHFAKWSAVARHIFLRPNALFGGLGFPTIYVHRLGEDMRFCLDRGMMMGHWDCCYQHWAGEGLNYYVLAKLLWEPRADVDAIVQDYCHSGFGPAADTIRMYFDGVERNTTEFARSNTEESQTASPELLARWSSREFFNRCDVLLDQANRQAADDEAIRQRIAFLHVAVEHGRIRHDWVVAKIEARNGSSQAVARLQEIEKKRDAFYARIAQSWALDLQSLRRYKM
jgi:hypothetical protein